jgi:drug/metabolite transporter (DMT)-like permease
MPPLLWAVVLSSTAAWAVFDVLRKRLAGKIPALELAVWLTLAQIPLYAVWWLVALGPVVPSSMGTLDYLGPTAASVAFNVAANLLFLAAVGSADLGATIPLLSLTPVFVALGSIPLLDERLEPANWLGIVLVTVGALFLPEVEGQRPTLRARFGALVGRRSSVFMVGTAALWALTPVLDKLALRHAPVPAHGFLLALGVFVFTALVAAATGRVPSRLPARRLGLVLVAAAVSVLALGLQFVAIGMTMVSVFEAFKRAAGLLLALVLGAIVFRERPTRSRVLAGLVMAVGVVLVLLPAGKI